MARTARIVYFSIVFLLMYFQFHQMSSVMKSFQLSLGSESLCTVLGGEGRPIPDQLAVTVISEEYIELYRIFERTFRLFNPDASLIVVTVDKPSFYAARNSSGVAIYYENIDCCDECDLQMKNIRYAIESEERDRRFNAITALKWAAAVVISSYKVPFYVIDVDVITLGPMEKFPKLSISAEDDETVDFVWQSDHAGVLSEDALLELRPNSGFFFVAGTYQSRVFLQDQLRQVIEYGCAYSQQLVLHSSLRQFSEDRLLYTDFFRKTFRTPSHSESTSVSVTHSFYDPVFVANGAVYIIDGEQRRKWVSLAKSRGLLHPIVIHLNYLPSVELKEKVATALGVSNPTQSSRSWKSEVVQRLREWKGISRLEVAEDIDGGFV